MLSEIELAMLSAFFPEGEERTTKEIENRSGYSHERVHSTLNALEKKGLLSKKRFGRTLVYSIARFNEKIFLAFAFFSIDKKERFVKEQPSVSKALEELIDKSKPDLAVLFGSYARGDAKERSDIDILCVNGTEVEKTALSLRHRYNLKIAPLIVKKQDFKNIRSENPVFWNELLKSGVILKGHELFFELIYKKC